MSNVTSSQTPVNVPDFDFATPAIKSPGYGFCPPAHEFNLGAPKIYSHSPEAGPDQTFFLAGENLTSDVVLWGMSDRQPGGEEYRPQVHFCTGRYLSATVPQRCYDGLFVGYVRSESGWSRPFVLNVPELWWVMPDLAQAGSDLRLFGRNLARRPDEGRPYVFLQKSGSEEAVTLNVKCCGKYSVRCSLPEDLVADQYRLLVHTGVGGEIGWSRPAKLQIVERDENKLKEWACEDLDCAELQETIDLAVSEGGGVVTLPEGEILLDKTLKLGPNVILQGTGDKNTVLRCRVTSPEPFEVPLERGTHTEPTGVSLPGNRMEFPVNIPSCGKWTVYVRYATEMSYRRKPGVSGKMSIFIDDEREVPLENLPNTGSFHTFRWSCSAEVRLEDGQHRIQFRNVRGGQMKLEAIAFSLADDLPPQDLESDEREDLVVLRNEDIDRFAADDGAVPPTHHVAVWLTGDGAGLKNVSIEGSPAVETGVLVRNKKFPEWIRDASVENVSVKCVVGNRWKNRPLHLRYAHGAVVSGCELYGQSGIYLSGVRQCTIGNNRLVCQTRYGSNANGAILGRQNIIEECAIVNNVVASPTGMNGGAGTVRRLLWVSTGHGSVSHNYIAGNTGARARFAGLAGTDQNVGETMLLEACQRIAYFGVAESAESRSVTLPESVPATPHEKMGVANPADLVKNEEGREKPFCPPDTEEDDGLGETIVDQYFVTVLDGPGIGQTRRVTGRESRTYQLERPWREQPTEESTIVVTTLFHQNLLVRNKSSDGMSGIQLWIGCVENVVADNTIERQRGGALSLTATCTTMASSMPRTWNRGIGVSNWNIFEGNLSDECSTGAGFGVGNTQGLPLNFPLALGNVLRHNTFRKNRAGGVNLRGATGTGGATNLGTIVEFNKVRDCRVAYHVQEGVDGVVLRRNFAYFWNYVGDDPGVGFWLKQEEGSIVVEKNVVEASHGRMRQNIEHIRHGEGD